MVSYEERLARIQDEDRRKKKHGQAQRNSIGNPVRLRDMLYLCQTGLQAPFVDLGS